MPRSNHADASSRPNRVDSRFEFVAIGNWSTGGELAILWQKKLIDTLSLKPSEWTALAALVKASQKSQNNLAAKAFLRADKLGSLVQNLSHRGDGTSTSAHTAIHKLRTALSKSIASEFSFSADDASKTWGQCVIETHARFGYRLSVDPSQLKLVLLDELEEPNES